MSKSKHRYPDAKRRLRLGIVGGGHIGSIGETHANGARLSNRWEVVAGALSSDAERSRAAGQRWLFAPDRIYSSYAEMAAKESARPDGIDAVTIVTPNHTHIPIAIEFIKHGIDIICDKPLAPRSSEVPALMAALKENDVIFALTYPYAFHSMATQVREMILHGEIGEIRQVHVEYFQEWASDYSTETAPEVKSGWRLDVDKTGDSFTTADIGTHAEHLLRYTTNMDITALRASFHVTGPAKSLEDTAFIEIKLANSVPGTVTVSQTMAGTHCGISLRIAGSKASISWQQEQPEHLTFAPLGEPSRRLSRGRGAGIYPRVERMIRMSRGHPEALTDAWANLYTEIAIAVEARRDQLPLPLISPADTVQYPNLRDGVLGLRFVEAAVRSNKSQAWEQIDTAW